MYFMEKLKKSTRKILVSLIGFPLLAIGIVLIPLPGPGLLVCFLAFFILSLEFEWAEKHLNTAKSKIKLIWEKSKPKIDK